LLGRLAPQPAQFQRGLRHGQLLVEQFKRFGGFALADIGAESTLGQFTVIGSDKTLFFGLRHEALRVKAVIPANAGISRHLLKSAFQEIPAFAGMTIP
jgi:hypothetical protein